MDRSSEDALWRSIVENYGERADLDASADRHEQSSEPRGDDLEVESVEETTGDPAEGTGDDGSGHDAARRVEAERLGAEFEERHELADRFVPPEPPPLPYVQPSRLLAWALVIGGPLTFVLDSVLGLGLPGAVRLIAVAGFLGGFVYLVVRMPRDPRDPWDDGARV